MDDKAIIEFLRKSYFATDGLWFLAVEANQSYEAAFEHDLKVWNSLSKIQARKAREVLGIEGDSLADLERSLVLKLTAESNTWQVVESSPNRLLIAVSGCPWYNVLLKAGRESHANDVCRICTLVLSNWSAEFSEDISFSQESKLPDGCEACGLLFTKPSPPIIGTQNR